MAFVIGDWLLCGFDRFGRSEAQKAATRVRTEDYESAIQFTGLDRATLQTYAHVSRKVPPLLRNKDLSWVAIGSKVAVTDGAPATVKVTSRISRSVTDEIASTVNDPGQPRLL